MNAFATLLVPANPCTLTCKLPKRPPNLIAMSKTLMMGILMLLSGPLLFGQLDCNNAFNHTLCERVHFDTDLGTNNAEAYQENPDDLFAEVATGKEVIHAIFWAGGDINIVIDPLQENSGFNGIYLLNNCEPVGTAQIYEQQLKKGENFIAGLPSGMWYVVVEGAVGSGGSSRYALQFTAPGVECGLDCADATEINISEANPRVTLSNQSLGEALNVIETYTEARVGNFEGRTSPERVYQINWPGGDMTATMDITNAVDLDLFLLTTCDPSQVVTFSTSIFSNETFETSLPAGTYYLVVDGVDELNGAAGNFDLTVQLTLPEEAELDCPSGGVINITDSNPSVTLSGQSTANGTNNVVDYYSPQFDTDFRAYTGPELVYEINWPGGDMIAAIDKQDDADLGIMLLNACDPQSVAYWSFNSGRIERSLDAGTYYLVVDARGGATGNYTLTVEMPFTASSCKNPISLTLGETYEGNTTTGEDLVSAYPSTEDDMAFGGFSGPDAVHSIEWPGGIMPVEFKKTEENLYYLLLSSCDPVNRIEYTNKTGENCKYLEPGEYFLVVDGFSGASGTYSLKIDPPAEPTPPTTCEAPIDITAGVPYIGHTQNGFRAFSTYNNDDRFAYSGPEVIHRIAWDGGIMGIFMEETSADLDFILLKSCDPQDFILTSERTFKTDLNPDAFQDVFLNPGTYYIIVDGWQGAEGAYKLSVYKYDEAAPCEDPSDAFSAQASTPPSEFVCYTDLSPSDAAYLQQFELEFQRFRNSPQSRNLSAISFPITAHFIRRSDGSGAMENEQQLLDEAVANLNQVFQGTSANISFNVCGTYEINDDRYYDYEKYMQYQLTQEHYVPNTINLYIAGTNGCTSLSGYAKFPSPGNPDLILIGQEGFNSNVLVHEMGHYFNLYHTHDRNFGNELADGSNCDAAGDLLCDTPADPLLRRSGDRANVTEACEYFGTELDANGEPYSPHTQNIMSYSFPQCLTEFSQEQIDRMAFAARNFRSNLACATSPVLTVDYLPTQIKVSGRSQVVSAGESISLSLTVQNNGGAAGQGNGGFDKFYFNTTPDLAGSPALLKQVATLSLGAGQSIEIQSGPLTIPANAGPGTYYILFSLDADNAVPESNEANNLVVQEIVIQNGIADYVPLDFKLDGQPSLDVECGQLVIGSVLAKNIGSGNGNVPTVGKLYYSEDNQFDPAVDLYFGDFNEIEPLAVGAGTNVPESIYIPKDAQLGTRYIFYWLDADQKIAESNENNNLAVVPINIVSCGNQGTSLRANFTVDNPNPCKDTQIQFSAKGFGSNILIDQSPKDRDGLLNNFPAAVATESLSPIFGKALQLDGQDDFVELPPNLTAGMTQFTFEALYYYEEEITWQRIMDFGENESKYMFLTPTNGVSQTPMFKITTTGAGGADEEILSSPDKLQPGQWYHIALVIDGNAAEGNAKLYVNGELKDAQSLSLAPADLGNLSNNYLGESQFRNSRTLSGALDEVRIWGTARSQSEIRSYQNVELSGREPGLMAYYNFNQALSGTVPTYAWSFEGGTPNNSTAANPVVSYSSPGAFSVSLSTSLGGESSTQSKSGFISVQECAAPGELVPTFSFPSTEACGTNPVQFVSNTQGLDRVSPNVLKDNTSTPLDGQLIGFNDLYTSHGNLGTSLVFDGENSYAELPENLYDGLEDLTIEFLFKYDAARAWQRIFDIGKSEQQYMRFVPTNNDGLAQFQVWDEINNVNGLLRWPTPLEAGKWYHFAFVWDASEGKIFTYRNGIRENTVLDVRGTSPATLAGPINYLGRSRFDGTALFKGQLDEFRIWNGTRTAAQVLEYLDKPLTGTEPGLWAYYNCNAGSGASYVWTFEKGTPSISYAANPQVNFPGAGIYEVSLTVYDRGKSQSTASPASVNECSSGPGWELVETGNNHTVIVPAEVIVTMQGATLEPGDYIGAFYREGNEERCAGKVLWEGRSVGIPVYGDDSNTPGVKDGFAEGEPFIWRIWKASNQETYQVAPVYEPIEGIYTHQGAYATHGISGLISLTYIPPSNDGSLTLMPGWNMVSTYIEAKDPNMTEIFDAIKPAIILVKDEMGKSYVPSLGINNVGSWLVEEGYQVKVGGTSPLQLTIRGEKADPQDHPLTLQEGWNIMAYLKDTPQDIADALRSIRERIILVKNIKGEVYLPSSNINSIGEMEPGQGYQILLNQNATLLYDANASSPALERPAPTLAQDAAGSAPNWPVIQTGDNHTLVLDASLVSDFDGTPLQRGDYIGVFYESDGKLLCGGKAPWTGKNIALAAFGHDHGNAQKDGFDVGESFTWKVWRAADGKVFSAQAQYRPFDAIINQNHSYTPNGISGISGLSETHSTGINSLLEMGVKLYPNPSSGKFWIELPPSLSTAEVHIYHYTGQWVATLSFNGERRKSVDLKNQAQGMYLIRLESENKVVVGKLQLVR